MRVCQGLGPFVISIVFFLGAAHSQDSHPPKVIETDNRRDIRDEGVFKPGSPLTVASPRNLPPAGPNEEPSLLGVKWHNNESISLAAGRKKVVSVEVAAPSLLLVKVDWRGAAAPVQVTLLRGSSVIASGMAMATAAGTGRTNLQAALDPGKFLVAIENVSRRPAALNIAIGSVPKERSRQ